MEKIHVAVDIGGSSVKITASRFSGGTIEHLKEQTLPNNPLRLQGSLYIDIYYLYGAIKSALKEYLNLGFEPVSFGIDTYGNGYGVFNADAQMIGLPFFYKDARTQGILPLLEERLALRELYERTGVYPTDIRVLMQLFHEVRTGRQRMRQADRILLFPDLLAHFFTGKTQTERSMASVASLLGPDGDWCRCTMRQLGIDAGLFGPLIDGGQNGVKRLLPSVCGELGTEDIRYVDVTTHDTESALLAAPMLDEEAVFASLGTSVILGARTPGPVISDEAYEGRFKNMRGAFGQNSLCRDYTGLWILEQCMASWRQEAPGLTYDDILSDCNAATENDSFFDVNHTAIRFYKGSLIDAIQIYCRDTGQRAPRTRGETALCVLESIALEAKWSFEKLKALVKNRFSRISAVGGGVKNALLLQMLADALGLPLLAGSPFAATAGNVLMQLYALGDIKTVQGIAEVARNSCDGIKIEPRGRGDKWERALARLEQYKME
ncbi:MAG: rhamnulokinase [Christensenellales bacterium]